MIKVKYFNLQIALQLHIQKWTYRVDYTRANEFGQGGEEEEEKDVGPVTAVATEIEIQKNVEKQIC